MLSSVDACGLINTLPDPLKMTAVGSLEDSKALQ